MIQQQFSLALTPPPSLSRTHTQTKSFHFQHFPIKIPCIVLWNNNEQSFTYMIWAWCIYLLLSFCWYLNVGYVSLPRKIRRIWLLLSILLFAVRTHTTAKIQFTRTVSFLNDLCRAQLVRRKDQVFLSCYFRLITYSLRFKCSLKLFHRMQYSLLLYS